MDIFWYIVLLFMISAYLVMDGYDFGAGIVHLFFAQNEKDKKSITKAIGPFWDANEVWLIAAGGILFFAFPTLYASSFSGFYLPLIIILWLLIFRAIGLELRGLVDNILWRSIWDGAFGMASLLLALFFGVALGNIVRGVNLGMVENGVSRYEGHFFFLPLWNSTFSPLSEELGVIDWFTVLIGFLAVVALTIHGANWIIYKTNASINYRLRKTVFILNFGLLTLVSISLLVWHAILENPFENFEETPWLWIFPLITLIGLFGLFGVRTYNNDGLGFLFSTLFLLGGLISTAVSIYPNLLPSTNNVNPSLTIHNTAASVYGQSVGLQWFMIALILIFLYFVVQHRVFRGKMDDISYGEH